MAKSSWGEARTSCAPAIRCPQTGRLQWLVQSFAFASDSEARSIQSVAQDPRVQRVRGMIVASQRLGFVPIGDAATECRQTNVCCFRRRCCCCKLHERYAHAHVSLNVLSSGDGSEANLRADTSRLGLHAVCRFKPWNSRVCAEHLRSQLLSCQICLAVSV